MPTARPEPPGGPGNRAARRRTTVRLAILGLLPLLLLGPTAWGSDGDGGEFTAECIGALDGDTISVLLVGRATTVRLEGIDAPEKGQPFSKAAKSHLASLAKGRTLTVHYRGRDRWDRVIGRAFVEGRDLSREMVAAGLAWHYLRYSKDPELAALQEQARRRGLGLWAQSPAVPPWDFRRLHEGASTSTPPPEGPLHGNTRSFVFHRPSCTYYDCRNCTAELETIEEALRAGFRPAGCCH